MRRQFQRRDKPFLFSYGELCDSLNRPKACHENRSSSRLHVRCKHQKRLFRCWTFIQKSEAYSRSPNVSLKKVMNYRRRLLTVLTSVLIVMVLLFWYWTNRTNEPERNASSPKSITRTAVG